MRTERVVTPLPGSDAGALATRIRAGDRTAETEMVTRFGPGVAATLRRATGRHVLAEDLYQDAFRLAITKIRRGELREPAKLPGFLYHLAHNLALSHFRRERQQDELDVRLADPAPNPLERLLADERAAEIRRVLAGLGSERDRKLLFLLYIREEDRRQLCQLMGLTPLHFNRVLFRARQRYRELFSQRAREGGPPRLDARAARTARGAA
jgi:RNA polymerase sigma-70 factor (ECF subfamily)